MLIDFDVGEDINFVDCAFFEFFVFFEFDDGNDFDCVIFFIVIIDSTIDFAINSRTNRLIECIIFNVFDHGRAIINEESV